MDQLLESIFRQFKFFQKFPFSGFYPKNWDFVDLEWPRVRSQDIQLSYHWRIKCWQGIMADLIWLTSDMSEKGQFFLSTRNYDSHQGNRMKNLSTPFDRKSNLKIINIFGREILNSGSGQKTLSKRHRPKTGRAARWELIRSLLRNIFKPGTRATLTPSVPQRQFLADASLTAFFAHSCYSKFLNQKCLLSSNSIS